MSDAALAPAIQAESSGGRRAPHRAARAATVTSRTAGAAAASASAEPLTDDLRLRHIPSFDDFYRLHRLPIARALSLTLGDVDLAGEATDEAMARAYQRWDRVSHLDNPGGWVYRVGLNWSRSVIRRITRPAPIWVAPATYAPPPTVQDPIVDRALASLPADQRAVVVCRFLLGWSEQQTADSLGIKAGTVKSRLHRALERLAPLLTPLQEARS